VRACSCFVPLLGWRSLSRSYPVTYDTVGMWQPRCRICDVILSTQAYDNQSCRVYEQGFYDAMDHIRNRKEHDAN
jgi:hypothetical protein